MKAYFQNKTLVIVPENSSEELALEYWGEGFFKKVDYNKEIEDNPFFLLIERDDRKTYEPKTETQP